MTFHTHEPDNVNADIAENNEMFQQEINAWLKKHPNKTVDDYYEWLNAEIDEARLHDDGIY